MLLVEPATFAHRPEPLWMRLSVRNYALTWANTSVRRPALLHLDFDSGVPPEYLGNKCGHAHCLLQHCKARSRIDEICGRVFVNHGVTPPPRVASNQPRMGRATNLLNPRVEV